MKKNEKNVGPHTRVGPPNFCRKSNIWRKTVIARLFEIEGRSAFVPHLEMRDVILSPQNGLRKIYNRIKKCKRVFRRERGRMKFTPDEALYGLRFRCPPFPLLSFSFGFPWILSGKTYKNIKKEGRGLPFRHPPVLPPPSQKTFEEVTIFLKALILSRWIAYFEGPGQKFSFLIHSFGFCQKYAKHYFLLLYCAFFSCFIFE